VDLLLILESSSEKSFLIGLRKWIVSFEFLNNFLFLYEMCLREKIAFN